jgi:hypothetical protein
MVSVASTEVTQHCQALWECQARQDVKLKSIAREFSPPMAASLLRHTACIFASCKLPSAAALVTACKDRRLQSGVKKLINSRLHFGADDMQAVNSIPGRLLMQGAICDISISNCGRHGIIAHPCL